MDKQNQVDPDPHLSETASEVSVNAIEEKELPPSSPSKRNNQQQQGLKGEVYLSELVEERAQLVFSLFGYSLLVFGLSDYLHILIPVHFTNPVWEFQTIGTLVEHVAGILLGLAMVFYRRQGFIGEWEIKLLGFLSWVCLLLGVLYLLMLPLGVANTWRIHNTNQAEISAQVSQQSKPLQQLKVKLNQAKTDEQLRKFFASLTSQGRTSQINKPQTIKDQLLTEISQTQWNIQMQANTARTTRRKALLKNSIKWNLGALVAGTLFILIWHLTDWARIRQY